VVGERKGGALLMLLDCGHKKWVRKWRGHMKHWCDDCMRGMKPQPIPEGVPIHTEGRPIPVRMPK